MLHLQPVASLLDCRLDHELCNGRPAGQFERTKLRRKKVAPLLTLALLITPPLSAAQRGALAAGPIAPSAPDPVIAQALRVISPERIQHTIETLVGFGTRNTLSSAAGLPNGDGIRAAAAWIASELRRYSADCHGCLEVHVDRFTVPPGPRIPRPTELIDVYAVMRGSDPAQATRMLLVTGHYDSRNSDVTDARSPAPGANDDASGVAVSLECARVASKLKLPATLVFAAVAGEEQGLFGSQYLAKQAKARHWGLEAVLNDDIVGGDTTPGELGQEFGVVRVFSEAIPIAATLEERKTIDAAGYESDSSSRELARAILEVSQTYDRAPVHSSVITATAASGGALSAVLEFRRDRFLRGGDQTSFNAEGFAAVRFTEWRENFDHQHQNVRTEQGIEFGDLPKFVNYNYVSRVAALNLAALASFALAPPPPANVQISTSALGNNTTLKWRPGPGAPPQTRYQVVWRASGAPQWTHAQLEAASQLDARDSNDPNSIEMRLLVAKDNVIFGVRAIDGHGHRSPAVVPWPQR